MAKVARFEELECWKEARALVGMVYKATSSTLISRDWDLVRQIRRASLSVMNNIAEGFARYHRKDFKHFLDISQSSTAEIKSMLYVIDDLNYIDKMNWKIYTNKQIKQKI